MIQDSMNYLIKPSQMKITQDLINIMHVNAS